MGEKVGELAQKINNLTNGEFTKFLLHHNLCPTDFEPLQRLGNELGCPHCGLVIDHEGFSNIIPFGSENTPGNLIAEGRGLGNTLWEKGLWSLIATSSGSNQDLPLRARQIMILTQKHEHPRIATLLRLGKKRSLEWGFGDYKGGSKAIMFSNVYGRVLRDVGAFLVVRNARISPKRVVDACLVITFELLNYMKNAQDAMAKYQLDPKFLQQIDLLARVMR